MVGGNAYVIEVQQKSDKLLISIALLHYATEIRARIQKSEQHLINSYKPTEPALNAFFLCNFPTLVIEGIPVQGWKKKTN